MNIIYLFLSAGFIFIAQSGFAETSKWEDQAERLQLINGAILDNAPIAEPVRLPRYIEARANISTLPKLNAKVGGKKEDVPSAPVHTVPSLVWNQNISIKAPFTLGYRAYAGFLPSGLESLFGIHAKLVQFSYGAAVIPSYDLTGMAIGLALGYHSTSADIKGGITSEEASDRFKVDTSIMYAAPYVRFQQIGMWVNAMLGIRSSESGFLIEEDATEFKVKDSASLMQAALGYDVTPNIQIGVAEQLVTQRFYSFRMFGGYALAF